MQFFQAVQDTVFSVIAPLQSSEAQLALAVSNGAAAEVQRVCRENPGLDPGTARTAEGLSMLAVAARAGKLDMFNQLRGAHHFDMHAADAGTGGDHAAPRRARRQSRAGQAARR